MLRLLAVLVVVLTPHLALAQRPGMPDSATGRALGGWLDLLETPAKLEADAFVARWLTPRAAEGAAARLERLLGDCRGAQIEGARKTGPMAATLMLVVPGADKRCSLSFELEAQPPNRIETWSADVSIGKDEGDDDGHESGGAALPALAIPDDRDAREAVATWLAELARQGLFSGSVLLAREGAVVFEGGYGLADRSTQAAAAADTRYDVGSITKSFTRVAIGQLLRAGKLKPQDTVQQRLPDYPNPEVGRRITVQQLLDHRSGLGDIFGERYRRTPKERLNAASDFFPLFADEPLQFEPDTSQSYSNAGFIVLGAIVEAVSGQDYAGYVAQHVFAPAGMADSGFLAKDGATPRLAIGYTRLTPSGERGELVPNLGRLPIRGCSAGSSSHTARDLLRFDRALRSGQLLGDWTGWYFGDDVPAAGTPGRTTAEDGGYGIAGGGPGVNAALESAGGTVVVVLANLDPPIAGQVARQLRAAAERLAVPARTDGR